mmetsp:Transcript_38495/g.76320  ORF Transcript_38495/g.76320 Transcript_38495/m.76320 type:complete len:246 (-) Transcript_38495:5-742(-)
MARFPSQPLKGGRACISSSVGVRQVAIGVVGVCVAHGRSRDGNLHGATLPTSLEHASISSERLLSAASSALHMAMARSLSALTVSARSQPAASWPLASSKRRCNSCRTAWYSAVRSLRALAHSDSWCMSSSAFVQDVSNARWFSTCEHTAASRSCLWSLTSSWASRKFSCTCASFCCQIASASVRSFSMPWMSASRRKISSAQTATLLRSSSASPRLRTDSPNASAFTPLLCLSRAAIKSCSSSS